VILQRISANSLELRGRPIISLVVAVDDNGLIGRENGLPWRLPDDMRWFREVTMGKPVVMGRKTYETIPARFRPLPGRHNIIITRDREYEAEGVTVVHSIEEALAAAGGVEEIIIGGGAELYAAFLATADRLYLTLVEGNFTGDAYFPPFNANEWQEVYVQTHEPDEQHAHRFHWLILERDQPEKAFQGSSLS
jgi:dihydrofolate reductase